MPKNSMLLTISVMLASTIQTLIANENNSAIVESQEVATLDKKQLVRSYVPKNAVIAHRGTTYWAPEETEAAFRWARNIGADYLEADLQLTKDGIILTLHDTDLRRTSNIKDVFPARAKDPTITFTYQELLQLDAGSWFNQAHPKRARPSFAGLEILTLEDVIKIAEGYKIKRDKNNRRVILANGDFAYTKDEKDNGNRPGVYIELKEPEQNPGIEKKLEKELTRLGWNIRENPASSGQFYLDGKVNVGKTNGKLVLQTFSEASLIKIQEIFKGEIPTTLLLRYPYSAFGLKRPSNALKNKINFANQHQAHFIGPSISSGIAAILPRSIKYKSDTKKANWIYAQGLGIHPYSFDTESQMQNWHNLANGMFTNRSDLTIQFYIQNNMRDKSLIRSDGQKTLIELGY